MSSTAFVQTSVIRTAKSAGTAPAATAPQKFKFIRPDYSVVLPLVAAVLLLVGFGIVATPMLVHDLPMLLK